VQFNQNSHWLDGSNIYGSGKSSPNLRVMGGGELLYSLPKDFRQSKISADLGRDGDHSKEFLPLSNPELCMDNQSVTVSAPCTDEECCVYAGDLRAGEQPPLASMHAVRKFRRKNRRIFLVFFQNSSFASFLPSSHFPSLYRLFW
jgi:hypothetical protein